MSGSVKQTVGLWVEARDMKMLRETLCRAQTAVGQRTYDVPYILSDIDRLSRLINEIDVHRPLDNAGKQWAAAHHDLRM